MSLLRNIRIPQNLGNKFAHAFASGTRPSRLGLEFEAKLKAQGLLNSRDLQLVQAYVSHKFQQEWFIHSWFQALNFCYRVVLAYEFKLSGLLAGDSLARLFPIRLHVYDYLYVVEHCIRR